MCKKVGGGESLRRKNQTGWENGVLFEGGFGWGGGVGGGGGGKLVQSDDS